MKLKKKNETRKLRARNIAVLGKELMREMDLSRCVAEVIYCRLFTSSLSISRISCSAHFNETGATVASLNAGSFWSGQLKIVSFTITQQIFSR